MLHTLGEEGAEMEAFEHCDKGIVYGYQKYYEN